MKLIAVAVAIAGFTALLKGPLAGVLALVLLALLDRVLLFAESRGVLNYRRNGLSRGAATYHTLELSAHFFPQMQEVIEVKYEKRRQADASGDPPAKDETGE